VFVLIRYHHQIRIRTGRLAGYGTALNQFQRAELIKYTSSLGFKSVIATSVRSHHHFETFFGMILERGVAFRRVRQIQAVGNDE
jgi:hypothetical protein